jgi:hypothetical protein
MFTIIAFCVGLVAGYYVGKNNVLSAAIEKTKEEIKKDFERTKEP